MKTLLRIDVSPRGPQSHSRRIADEVVQHLVGTGIAWQVVGRELTAETAGVIDGPYVGAMLAHRSKDQSADVPELAHSEQLISELETSDALVISTPVHNYTVPASLKAWIDQVVRIGRTFKSTPEGKVGILRDRPTIVVSASGGYFANGSQPDFFAPYLDAILATIGICDVTHFRLEGVTRGDEAVALAYERAREGLRALRLQE